ncbi:aminomethyl-transferring glycine dehydrogenase subunit GcvPB [Aureliella helgolandensis]|uniref:Probable glycine dehydrogenase (decarboxylating) subunit 2 n=1 Tax=Aureliella helgolandensis TaxID=2527968 RepID=A0A518GF09_9BACT|nr:aminomethyl-transferring glycine dehydrogenase subunit GcvPB [Aureliella helgolandensis]QDV27173.1 putative glycine dehydrogenase (decarboxylating) subunit 2 [Aureliella helgolandensis]
MRNTQATQLLFELGKPGRRANRLPECDVPAPDLASLYPRVSLRSEPLGLPELGEGDVVRHFTNLSTLNMSVDTHFYPLGSCTMKYNPKRNERLASLPGIVDLHPLQPDDTVQGMLELLYEVQTYFAEISGLPAVSLQPAAGAHGELTALMAAAAYFRDRGEARTKVLVPDSAHGTNPASATMVGFQAVTIRSRPDGSVDMEDLRSKADDQTAVFMITNPSTLGLFEKQIHEITTLVHEVGGLIYLDGANMNAILGISRPGDFGADMMHYNPHKTFSGPHGGGGPGAGPICVRDFLEPYLPVPRVAKHGQTYSLESDHPRSIGRVRSFNGNIGVLVRAYCYIRAYGARGMKEVSQHAVLNANYLLARLKHVLPIPNGDRCMHEFVASASRLKKEKGVTAMDIAKRLLDFGFHAPTVYFPLTVPEAMMIEPTETESKETMDAFVVALETILAEPAENLHHAPSSTAIVRPDEVKAARQPVMRWTAST